MLSPPIAKAAILVLTGAAGQHVDAGPYSPSIRVFR